MASNKYIGRIEGELVGDMLMMLQAFGRHGNPQRSILIVPGEAQLGISGSHMIMVIFIVIKVSNGEQYSLSIFQMDFLLFLHN